MFGHTHAPRNNNASKIYNATDDANRIYNAIENTNKIYNVTLKLKKVSIKIQKVS